MNNAKDLIFDFDAFTGSLNQYSHKLPMTPELRLTDGTKAFAERMGAYWFMDIIATEFLPLLSEEDYIIFIEVTVNDDNSAVIIGTDGDKGDGPITLHTRTIEYTDLPPNSGFLPYYKFYLSDGLLMLPSEY
tara:strand:+ start:909 stop:1304 length:396 start_codon:yes stop_codon:yes gene_type:complete